MNSMEGKRFEVLGTSNGVTPSTRPMNLEVTEQEQKQLALNSLEEQADQLDAKKKPLDFPGPFGQKQVCIFQTHLNGFFCLLLE